MKFESALLIFIYLVTNCLKRTINSLHPDEDLSIVQLIKKYGYPVEVHEIVTEDDYFLTIFRIPHGRKGFATNRKPFLLMHGLLGQAENFIINGMNNGSLAYFLADNGYDVWLGNNRGTQHGLKHKVLDYRSKTFWKFSIHELGIYDLPAMIDYVLAKTNKRRLFYSGHSQGGSIYFIMASFRPEYQKKIALAPLLAPGGYEKNFKNRLLLPLALEYKSLEELNRILNLWSIPPVDIHITGIKNACATTLQDICLTLYFILSGQIDFGEFNKEMLPIMLEFVPSVSVEQLFHFAQVITTGHFSPRDYGKQKNMELYGKILPDDYPLGNIQVPTAFFYTYNDSYVFAKDVEDMCDAIKNCVYKYVIKKRNWSHYDFIFGVHIAEDLFGPFLEISNKYDVEEE